MAYTPDGQVASVSYSGTSLPGVTYIYDADDQVTSVTDGSGTTTSSYDPFGELASTTNGAGKTVSYTYDSDGHTTGVTYPLPPPLRGRHHRAPSATPTTRQAAWRR